MHNTPHRATHLSLHAFDSLDTFMHVTHAISLLPDSTSRHTRFMDVINIAYAIFSFDWPATILADYWFRFDISDNIAMGDTYTPLASKPAD
jgi:hypothetical protein